MRKYYVYLHKRQDSGCIFYIGRGYLDRAYRKGNKRSKEWNNIVNSAGGFTVEFIAIDLTKTEAIKIENYHLENPNKEWNLVNKKKAEVVKNLNELRSKFLHYFEYNEKSPSGLIWRNKYKNAKISVGSNAGHLNKKHGYYEVSVEGKRYYAHRVIYVMFHYLDSTLVVDHIDKNQSNNRLANLRAVPQSENCRNRTFAPNSKTGIVGVQYTVNARGNEYYQASYIEDGKPKLKLFSFKKLGKDLALKMAIEFRQLKMPNTLEEHYG